jgi:hypothetical protein
MKSNPEVEKKFLIGISGILAVIGVVAYLLTRNSEIVHITMYPLIVMIGYYFGSQAGQNG